MFVPMSWALRWGSIFMREGDVEGRREFCHDSLFRRRDPSQQVPTPAQAQLHHLRGEHSQTKGSPSFIFHVPIWSGWWMAHDGLVGLL